MTRTSTEPNRSAPAEKRERSLDLDTLETPALLVDLDVLEENLREMAALAKEAGVALRPHWKTHKCLEIARRQVELGAVGGTVAKAGEVEVFLAAGFDDVLIATPIVDPRKIERLLELRGDATITVLVESEAGAEAWSHAVMRARAAPPVPVLLEVDAGMRRTGVPPKDGALPLARRIRKLKGLALRGLITHAGHAYAARSEKELFEIGRSEGELLVETANTLRGEGIECAVVSVGSTPTVRVSSRVPGVTEIRPGNYVFYDGIQVGLGIVPERRCALTVLATVVSRPEPTRVVIDAGSKTLTTDRGTGPAALRGFGRLAGLPDCTLERLSEEHGILEVAQDALFEVGDRVRVLPNHACTAVNLHEELHAVRGERVVETWRIAARGRIA